MPHGKYMDIGTVDLGVAIPGGVVPPDAPLTLVPHALQKRAPTVSAAPQVPQVATASAAPHWLQNLPEARAPHDGHTVEEGLRFVIRRSCQRPTRLYTPAPWPLLRLRRRRYRFVVTRIAPIGCPVPNRVVASAAFMNRISRTAMVGIDSSVFAPPDLTPS